MMKIKAAIGVLITNLCFVSLYSSDFSLMWENWPNHLTVLSGNWSKYFLNPEVCEKSQSDSKVNLPISKKSHSKVMKQNTDW